MRFLRKALHTARPWVALSVFLCTTAFVVLVGSCTTVPAIVKIRECDPVSVWTDIDSTSAVCIVTVTSAGASDHLDPKLIWFVYDTISEVPYAYREMEVSGESLDQDLGRSLTRELAFNGYRVDSIPPGSLVLNVSYHSGNPLQYDNQNTALVQFSGPRSLSSEFDLFAVGGDNAYASDDEGVAPYRARNLCARLQKQGNWCNGESIVWRVSHPEYDTVVPRFGRTCDDWVLGPETDGKAPGLAQAVLLLGSSALDEVVTAAVAGSPSDTACFHIYKLRGAASDDEPIDTTLNLFVREEDCPTWPDARRSPLKGDGLWGSGEDDDVLNLRVEVDYVPAAATRTEVLEAVDSAYSIFRQLGVELECSVDSVLGLTGNFQSRVEIRGALRDTRDPSLSGHGTGAVHALIAQRLSGADTIYMGLTICYDMGLDRDMNSAEAALAEIAPWGQSNEHLDSCGVVLFTKQFTRPNGIWTKPMQIATVMVHELGHAIGFIHQDSTRYQSNVMANPMKFGAHWDSLARFVRYEPIDPSENPCGNLRRRLGVEKVMCWW